MFELTICSGGTRRTVPAAPGQLVSDLLRQYIPSFALPCAGNHTCGKCRVQVSGAASPVDAAETRLLSDEERAQGVRLACSCRVAGDLTASRLRAQGATGALSFQTKRRELAGGGVKLADRIEVTASTCLIQTTEKETASCLN